MTSENKKWESLKTEYLHKVEKALSSVKHPRGKEVLEDVRSHLDSRYSELAPEQRTPENFQSIITEMGPASDYAELLEPQVVKHNRKFQKKHFIITGIAVVVILMVISWLQPRYSTLKAEILSEKISKLDIDNATIEDVIDVFGKPQKYIWGDETYKKDNLPYSFIMNYPDGFSVYMSDHRVIELRNGESGKKFLWNGKLKVGYALTKVLEEIGKPIKTIEGQENQYEDGVLYKDIEGKKGHCYYERDDLDLRLWFRDYKLIAIYMTRSDYGEDREGDEKVVIASTSKIDEDGRIVDKIDYPFVSDPNVIGAWKSVDFVETKDEFNPDRKNWKGELWLNHLIFEEGGSVAGAIYTWTKGLVINEESKTASAYDIKKIGDADYMFFEWKSGDYTIRHEKPSYYVLKRVPLEDVKSEAMFGETAQLPATSIIDENGRIIDKIDYPFVNDPEAIGAWESVDFVDEIEDFEPGEKHFGGDLFLKELYLLENGKTSWYWSWTKGHILSDDTDSKYVIKEIDNVKYMFFEWKSGDYTIRHSKPSYYVLKYIPGKAYVESMTVDKIDYPFVNDPDVIGTWKSVDFVETPDEYFVGVKQWKEDLFLKELVFLPDGKMNDSRDTWTKGLVLDPGSKTASRYLLKEIDGSTYMFYEWKSGDYTLRGRKPKYYVLKKE